MQRCWRLRLLIGFLTLCGLAILYRLVDLTILDRSFLMKQGNARIVRHVVLPANRGMVVDRHNQPLAISTPVASYWFDPLFFNPTPSHLIALSHIVGVSPVSIRQKIAHSHGRRFVYLRRHLSPTTIKAIKRLKIKGLYFKKEYQRYYPEGALMAHVVGFTNIDDEGQEGLELAFNDWLKGVPGKQTVVRDRLGRVVDVVRVVKKPQQGKRLALSIDKRIQFISFQALSKAIKEHHAQSGSIVVMDVHTGEVLAMANLPAYNPNNRSAAPIDHYRNRAITDLFEPGSTIKPFTVALGLMSKKYHVGSTIDTNPGRMRVGGFTIRDDGLNYGVITLTQLLQKSSNIGAAKLLLSLNARHFWHLLQALGLGQRTHSGFPGEADGLLTGHDTWYPSEIAALAYGYGVSVTALQLVHAYAALGDAGLSHPVTLLKQTGPLSSTRVLPSRVAKQVLAMLKQVVHQGGTGHRAAIPGYQVAGKTGTAYIAGRKGYNKKRYVSSFVGLAPASAPRLAVAVVIRDPKKNHFGAVVAAPTFQTVMEQSLHLMNIAPDNLSSLTSRGRVADPIHSVSLG